MLWAVLKNSFAETYSLKKIRRVGRRHNKRFLTKCWCAGSQHMVFNMKIKAILLILSAAVLLVLCSCKNNNFKGVWVSDYNSNAYIEFLDDKTVVFGSNGEALTSGTYTLEKNVLTIKLNKDENEVFVKSTCLLSQNHLVLTNDEGKQEKFSRK
jgi:hypothetical protein